MRILLMNQYYRPDVAATGQLLADLAEALIKRGHEVHVLCSSRAYNGGTLSSTRKRLTSGVHVHYVKATGFGRKQALGRIIDYASFYFKAMWRALTLPKMDLCISLTTPPLIGLVGVVLKAVRGTRLVLWSMDLYPELPVAFGMLRKHGILHRILSRLSAMLYRSCDALISIGNVMAQRLIAAGSPPERIVTVQNWVPAEVVKPMPRDASSVNASWKLNGEMTLMYSGNIGLGHDLETMLRAIHQLEDNRKPRVLFVGNGALKKHLQQLVNQLRLDCVTFHPPQPLYALAENLATGDVHVVSQKPGTQGLMVPSKIYGIMAAGRPAIFIGPRDCEVAQIVRESNAGFLVEPGDVAGATKVLQQLLDDPETVKRMGRQAREYYEMNFGRDRSINRIIDTVELHGLTPTDITRASK